MNLTIIDYTLAFCCKQTRRAKLFPLGISGHRRVMSSAQSDWSSSNLCLLPAYLSLPESSLFSPWPFGLEESPERRIEIRRVVSLFHNTNWKYWKQCDIWVYHPIVISEMKLFAVVWFVVWPLPDQRSNERNWTT